MELKQARPSSWFCSSSITYKTCTHGALTAGLEARNPCLPDNASSARVAPLQPTFRCTSLRIRYSAERSRQTLRLGGTLTELKISGEKLWGPGGRINETESEKNPHLSPYCPCPASAYRMVCRQVQDTVHHIFSSRFWSAPVMRNLQKGTLQSSKASNHWLGPLLENQGPVYHPPACPLTHSGSCFLWLSQNRRQERDRPS